MIRRLSLFFFSLAVAGSAFSQTLTWKNYTSMYDISGIAVSGGKVWAATTGGVFSYAPSTGAFSEFTTTEGLSNIQATAICSDSSGRLIVGEVNGAIDELDSTGRVIRSQRGIVDFSALTKEITSLSIAGDTIFASTPFGVVLISRKSFNVLDTYSHFDPKQGSIQSNAVAVFGGRIYVGSQFGLSYAPTSAINLAAPDLWRLADTLGLANGVNDLEVFDGKLFVATKGGLYYTSDGFTFQLVTGSPSGGIHTLTPTSSDLLVNAASGLYSLSSTDGSFKTLYSGGTQLNGVAQYSDTLMFAATANGMLVVGASSQFLLPPGPATNTISDLAVDSSGNLWCAANNGDPAGVAFMEFNGTNWKNYYQSNLPQLKSNQNVKYVSAVCGNKIILGTWGFGMLMMSGDTTKYYGNTNSTLVGEPNSANYVLVGNAACDQSGNIWITNPLAYNGNSLDVYSPSDSTWHSFHNGLGQTSAFIPIAIDAYNGVWTGDAFGQASGIGYGGLFYYNDNGTLDNLSDDQSYLFTTNNSSLLSNQVNSVVVDNDDQVWIGTSLGLMAIYDPDPANVFYISTIYSLYDQFINSIDYDALDQKWVATNTGVYVISNDGNTSVASYNTANSPLPSDKVVSIACDRKDGIVYMATEYGITELKTGVKLPLQSFAKLKVFPDPAVLPISQPIHIEGLVANSEIKIFSIDGKLVDQFQAQGGNVAYWNGTDQSGNILPTGVYIVVAYSSDGSQSSVTKIALIHK